MTASGISGSQHYETLDGERLRDHNCKMRIGNIVRPGHENSNFRDAANPAVMAAPQKRGADVERFPLTRCTRYGIASPPICSSRTSTYAKLDTTARYTRVDTNIIREIMSPPDRLTPLVPRKTDPPAAEPVSHGPSSSGGRG